MTEKQSSSPATPVRYPLGLPAGSVRAILTLLVVWFIAAQAARGEPTGLLWSETLMIMLAHYFTSRRIIELPPDVRAQLEAQGAIENEHHPLHLPRHSIRALIVLSFVGLAVYLYRDGRLFVTQSLQILGTVGAYFLGLLFKAFSNWRKKRKPDRGPIAWWDDLKALATLGIVAATVLVELCGWQDALPFKEDVLQNVTLGLVLFYFGSR